MRSSKIRRKLTRMRFRSKREGTTSSYNRTVRIWRIRCLWLSNFPPSSSICARCRLIWGDRRTIKRPTRCRLVPINWRNASGSSTWIFGARRLWRPRQLWWRNSRTRWVLFARNSKGEWASALNYAKSRTMRCYSATKMQRSSWRTSRG